MRKLQHRYGIWYEAVALYSQKWQQSGTGRTGRSFILPPGLPPPLPRGMSSAAMDSKNADKAVSSYGKGSSSIECGESQVLQPSLPPEIWANVLACKLMFRILHCSTLLKVTYWNEL